MTISDFRVGVSQYRIYLKHDSGELMNGLYKQAFGKEDQTIPKEVVRELNKDLPKGYKYVWNKKLHQLVISPTKTKAQTSLKFVVDFDTKENELPIKYNDKELMEYIYRTQKTIKAKSVYVIDKKGEKRNIYEDPIMHKDASGQTDIYIRPSPFPDAVTMIFTVGDGEKIPVKIKRQPYDSMDQILLENQSPSGIKIRWLFNEKKHNKEPKDTNTTLPDATMKVTATPSMAHSVEDALFGLKILLAFTEGTLLIDGHKSEEKPAEGVIDINDIKEKIFFWETIKKLQEVLNVKFDPGADYPVEDARFVYELDQNLLKGKEQVLNAPFEHFYIGEMKLKENERKTLLDEHPEIFSETSDSNKLSDNEIVRRDYSNRLVGKPNSAFTFVQDMDCSLLGAKFHLLRATILSNITLKKIDPEGKGMKLYISNGKDSDNPWKMITKYTITEDEAEKELDVLFNKYCGEKK